MQRTAVQQQYRNDDQITNNQPRAAAIYCCTVLYYIRYSNLYSSSNLCNPTAICTSPYSSTAVVSPPPHSLSSRGLMQTNQRHKPQAHETLFHVRALSVSCIPYSFPAPFTLYKTTPCRARSTKKGSQPLSSEGKPGLIAASQLESQDLVPAQNASWLHCDQPVSRWNTNWFSSRTRFEVFFSPHTQHESGNIIITHYLYFDKQLIRPHSRRRVTAVEQGTNEHIVYPGIHTYLCFFVSTARSVPRRCKRAAPLIRMYVI